jgi:DNA-binding transcriptional LysR family regulator
MEMHQVRYFLALCEHGGFARAAEACDVSQPALTTAMKRLEQEFGGPLFHREGKRLVLSRLGQMVRPHIEQLQGESQAAVQIARNFRLLKTAPLTIGVMPTIGPTRIARFFERFRRQNPHVELAVSVASLGALLKQLEKDELDFALVSAPQGLPDTFRTEPGYQERYMVVFPPGHRFERFNTIALSDVTGENYVDRLACEMREAVMGLCAERKVELYANYRCEREDWIEAMVAAGLGFAFMPEYSVKHEGVLARPLVDPQVERTLLLVDVRGRRRSPAAQAFAQALATSRWEA